MTEPIRRIRLAASPTPSDPDALVTREWLVTNGLGGYASGTVAGVITRRYHGLLIAALPAPLGRMVMLSHVAEQLRLPDGRRIEIGGRERSGDAPDAHGTGYLDRVPARRPACRSGATTSKGCVIEKRLFLPHMQNTVHVMYELLSRRRPRGAGAAPVGALPRAGSAGQRAARLAVRVPRGRRAVRDLRCTDSPLPPLRLQAVRRATRRSRSKGKRIDNVLYPVEESRGYQARGELWSPGYFRFDAARRAARRRWSRRPSRGRR